MAAEPRAVVSIYIYMYPTYKYDRQKDEIIILCIGDHRLGFEVWGIPIQVLAPMRGDMVQDVGDAEALDRNCV